MRSQAAKHFNVELPSRGEYAVANVFFPPLSNMSGKMSECKAVVERLVKNTKLQWTPQWTKLCSSLTRQDSLFLRDVE